jgi:hypothetical protein
MTTLIKARMEHLHYPYNLVDEWDHHWRPEKQSLSSGAVAFLCIVATSILGLLVIAWPA